MTRLISLKRSFIALLILTLVAVTMSRAQAPPDPASPRLPDGPQILNSEAGKIRVVPIKGLRYPWALAFLPDGSILVTEKGRYTLRLVRNGVLDPAPITGLPQGMKMISNATAGLDIALHPRFAENRLVYFTYWKLKPGTEDIRTAVLGRGRFDGTALTDVRDLFVSNSWTDGPVAARIVFARDGKIFMVIGSPGFARTLGDPSTAQNPGEHAGKVLRLNDDGSAPQDNPFVGRPGYKPEIYALGIRNAVGFMIHPETGELWETEHGPQGGDEVNIIKRGANYGWPVITYGRAYSTDPEGTRSGLPPPPTQPPTSAPGMEEPFLIYIPSIAISGMTFYTGDKFPSWKGNLVVGGLRGTQLSRITLNRQGLESRRETFLTELRQRIRDVRQGPDGLLYVTTDEEDGAILRIEPAPAEGEARR